MWLPDRENVLKIRLFVSTEYTNVTDRRTDRRTPRRHRLRLCIASRGKNGLSYGHIVYLCVDKLVMIEVELKDAPVRTPYIWPSPTQDDQSMAVRRGGNRQAPASTSQTTVALHGSDTDRV